MLLGDGCWVLGAGCWVRVLGAWCLVLGAGCWGGASEPAWPRQKKYARRLAVGCCLYEPSV